MKLSKPPNNQCIARTIPIDWLSFVTDDRAKLVIPVGPRFQVDVPSWIPLSRLTNGDMELDNTKWLGTPTWPLSRRSQDKYQDMVGRGRPRSCTCELLGSVECVRRHMADKRSQLKIDLGPAFWIWKFDVMGEDVAKLWNQEEQMKFDHIVKKNLTSHGTSFMKFASKCFPWKSKGSIISYYFNVYIPRRISVQTRSIYSVIHTDDDDDNDNDDDGNVIIVSDDDDDDGEDVLRPKGSRKRLHADFTCSSHKYIKTAYLGSCR